jgi:hypothetical protein
MVKPENDSKQPWRQLGGLTYAFASDLMASRPQALSNADRSDLAKAIRRAFKTTHPIHQGLIARRFRELYSGLPEEDAVLAVSLGHSHPIDAMRAGVIRRRKRIGFIGERTP